MSRILEEMRNEVAEKEKVSTALKMLAKGYEAEEIAEITGLSLEEVMKLADNQKG